MMEDKPDKLEGRVLKRGEELFISSQSMTGTLTVGLLGAEIDPNMLDTPSYLTGARLEEIERRILAIEAMVWPLGR
jgi:hypothetical protein